MKILKRIGLGFLTLITLLALWIAINSIDDRELSAEAREMLKPFPEVPPEENGYEPIKYMSDENFELPYDIEWEKVVRNLHGKEWDEAFVKAITTKNQLHITNLSNATLKPRFKFPEANKAMDLPPYQNYIRVVRLLLLQAKQDAHESNFEPAFQKIDTGVSFCQKIMLDETHYLISYFLGISCLSDAFGVAHEIISNKKIDNKLLINTNKSFLETTSYSGDGFNLVFYGETRFIMGMAQEMSSRSFTERLHNAKSFLFGSDFGSYDKTRVILAELFPAYYFPANNSVSRYAVIYKEASESAGLFCKDNPVVQQGPEGAITISPLERIILPGKLQGAEWVLDGYFERRCLAHSYFDAIRTIIAIHAYQQDHHSLPSQLSDLVPAYIERLPTDYFDGEPLRYSRENKWLYSVGTDYNDDGGSPEGYMRFKCDASNRTCNTNPTFPIDWNDYPVSMR